MMKYEGMNAYDKYCTVPVYQFVLYVWILSKPPNHSFFLILSRMVGGEEQRCQEKRSTVRVPVHLDVPCCIHTLQVHHLK